MKFYIYPLSILLIVGLTRCNNTNEKEKVTKDTISTETPETTGTPAIEGATCFRKITGRDTLILQLVMNNDTVSGTMFFDNYEKDSSHGSVSGSTQNGLIVVWYDFFSEGMQSVVQHAFKPTGNNLLLGTGALTYRNDSAFIKNLDQINFRPENLLERVDCQAVETQLNAIK